MVAKTPTLFADQGSSNRLWKSVFKIPRTVLVVFACAQ
jgi:hypothetical protein